MDRRKYAKRAISLAAIAVAGLLPLDRAIAATGDRLSRDRLGPVAFHDDFRQGLSVDAGCASPTARYVDQFCGEGATNGPYARTHGEHQCYSDRQFNGVDPFSVRGGALTITALAAPKPSRGPCAATKYTSGMISTRNSFRMTRGYWEVVAQMPAGGQARWPAIWLKAAQWPPEIDIDEMAQGVLYGTQHSRTHPGGLGDKAPALGCLCDRPHAFGLMNTGGMLVWYVDGIEWRRALADPGVGDAGYYLVVNLAINGGAWTGPETPASVPAQLRILSISAYPSAH